MRELREETKAQSSIRIGRLTVREMFFIGACHAGGSLNEVVRFEFEWVQETRSLDPRVWPSLQTTWLEVLKRRAAEQGAHFEDRPIADMVTARVVREESDGPIVYRAEVAPSSYYIWAATSNLLDERLRDRWPDAPEGTLREYWNLRPAELSDVKRLPAPAHVAIGVAVISDGAIFTFRRTRGHYVANTGWHFIGEGMTTGDREPIQTARRGLIEELDIREDQIIRLIPTGAAFDLLRWQPVFTFVAEVQLGPTEVFERIKSALAPHGYEVSDPRTIPWTIKDPETRNLLLAETATEDGLASNHAQMILLMALLHQEGFEPVQRGLAGG